MRPERPVFRTWRGAVFASAIVGGGVVTAGLTLYARRANDPDLAFIAATLSLVFVVLMGVFVVPPLARAARGEVGRLDFPVSITWGGLTIILLTGAVVAGAWATGNNLLFLAFSLLTSLLFVSWAGARASLRDLSISVRFPDHIFAGESVPIAVTLNNRKWIVPSVSVFVEMRGMTSRRLKQLLAYFAYVPRRTPHRETFNIVFPARGRILVNSFDLISGFPLGLIRVRRRLRTRDMTLIILPALQSVDAWLVASAAQARASAFSTVRGEGTELYSLRRYAPHDDRRRIAWKATARTNRLMVREYLAEDEPRVSVWLDTTFYRATNDAPASGQTWEARFEQSISIAASLVAHYEKQNAALQLRVGDEGGRYDGGAAYRDELLRRLAVVEQSADDERSVGEFWEDAAQSSLMRDEQRFIVTTAPAERIPPSVWQNAQVISIAECGMRNAE